MVLRIALVTESFLPQINGVTNSVLRILEGFAREGHEALVIAPESADAPREYAGFRVKHVPSLEMKGLIPVGFPQRALEPLIDGFAPDVIHLASPIFLGSYVTKIATRLEIPTLSVYQTDIAGFARHYGMSVAHSGLKKWVAKIHSQTNRTLAPSKWSCSDLAKSGVPNVHLWQRGVDNIKFSPVKRDPDLRNQLLGHRSDRKIIGYVGRLANEKRVEDLLVLDQRDDIQIVIIGEGPARTRLERLLPNARFVGYQSGEDLARYYASLDIFVHTGKHETFCQSIQEALASGIPVIAPNFGGPTDLVQHEFTGYLIDTADSQALSRSVTNILTSFDAVSVAVRARESVIKRTWPLVHKQLINHYYEILSESATRVESEKVA
ncbi:MAG: phosphatidylinositol alpha 1,6-mannosyltransferase [Actinobacteria bacterium]|jgi:phosphatidylinositol alpha 1,6-mannosyltransferase|nr:phosphatidylinositol alpha 1,6-mannosyltransferase [Actinomycetota bacterium]